MNIFKCIQLGHSGTACENCVNFQNDPEHIETMYPGLKVMSSGYASVRDKDGFCNHHQLYLAASDSCTAFERNNQQLTSN